MPPANQRDSIQILHPTKVYNFDYANACFANNHEDDILERLRKLSIIFCHPVFHNRNMSMEKLKAQVQHLHGLQQADRAKCEATWKIGLEQEAKRKVVIEACLRSFYRGWIFELQ